MGYLLLLLMTDDLFDSRSEGFLVFLFVVEQ